jgi:hypothetical protein
MRSVLFKTISATDGPEPAERMIDHYHPAFFPFAPAGPAPAERMVDYYRSGKK